MRSNFLSFIGNVDLAGLIRHTQQLTNSVYQMVNRGLTIQDNLQMAYVNVLIVSGRPFVVSHVNVPVVKGAVVCQYNCTILKQSQRRISASSVEITVWFDGSTSEDVTVLLTGN